MKKHFFLVAALAAGLSLNAQTLPLDYTTFFAESALASDGEHLERDAYASTTQGSSGEALKAFMWSRSGKATDQGGDNPAIAANTLEYGNYIDNLKGKEIILANLPIVGETNQLRSSIFGLKSNYDYSGAPYYMAALVQINEAAGKGDILAFDRLYVNKQGSGYKLGLGWNGDPTVWTEELAFGSTQLVVIKIVPCGNVSGEQTETGALWINPDLSKSEAENTVFAEVSYTNSSSLFKSVRGITIRQRSKIGGKIAGLRFSDNWADVAKAAEGDETTAMDQVSVDSKARKVMVEGQMLIERNGEFFNVTGAKVK